MKSTRKYGIVLLAAALLPLAGAQAAEFDNRWYLAPGVSYLIGDDDRQADDGMGFQLGIGKAVSEHWNMELSATTDKLDISTGTGKFDQLGLGIDGLYLFDRAPRFSPYLVVGAGALRTKVAGNSGTHPMLNAGAGVMAHLTDYGLALRADARYRMDNDNDSIAGQDRFGDWMVNLGLAVPLGAKPQHIAAAPIDMDGDADGVLDSRDRCPGTRAGAKVDASGCEVESDSDNDGVPNSQDKCPGTVKGVKVDTSGCEVDVDGDRDGVVDSQDKCPNTAAGVKVNASGCEVAVDSDRDGVVDAQDKCPNTPAGVKVDASGCEIVVDSDGDGITDNLDKCPDTKPAVKVDNKGCALAAVIKLEGVTFATNSARLTQDSEAILNDAAETLRRNADLKVEVAGHTDNRGNRQHNIRLSQQRAEAVRTYLVSKGISSANLTAQGYGPDKPVADNASEQGRAANRRVELRLLNN